MNNVIFSRAPVRICDIGGWTDTWFYPKGTVFNICIDLFSHVKIIPNNTNKIKIISENLNLQTEIQDISKIEYNGNIDLLKAAVKRMGIENEAENRDIGNCRDDGRKQHGAYNIWNREHKGRELDPILGCGLCKWHLAYCTKYSAVW